MRVITLPRRSGNVYGVDSKALDGLCNSEWAGENIPPLLKTQTAARYLFKAYT